MLYFRACKTWIYSFDIYRMNHSKSIDTWNWKNCLHNIFHKQYLLFFYNFFERFEHLLALCSKKDSLKYRQMHFSHYSGVLSVASVCVFNARAGGKVSTSSRIEHLHWRHWGYLNVWALWSAHLVFIFIYICTHTIIMTAVMFVLAGRVAWRAAQSGNGCCVFLLPQSAERTEGCGCLLHWWEKPNAFLCH